MFCYTICFADPSYLLGRNKGPFLKMLSNFVGQTPFDAMAGCFSLDGKGDFDCWNYCQNYC